MAKQTSRKSVKGAEQPAAKKATAKKTAAKQVAAKAPHQATAKSSTPQAKPAAARKRVTRGAADQGATNKKRPQTAQAKGAPRGVTPTLLSGGNPQIAKGYGDAPIQAYIAAMPGWKSDVGRRLDALIMRTVPNVHKAVKWNSPLYGIEDQGWFLGVHCFTKYIKVAFFRGMSLQPIPPGESKSKETRYLNIHEGDPIDESQFVDWVKQASQLPGERM